MKREEANGDRIRPGDVYEYSCCNDQGYGYMIPVKTSGGWDYIDTYQLAYHGVKTERPVMTHQSGESSSWATASMMDT